MHKEYKYLIRASEFKQIKSEMLPYLVLDKNADRNKNKDYTVRSVYFDTPQLSYYYEKLEGIKVRKKLRIRAYDEYFAEQTAFLEIKRKNESCVSKHRARLYFRDIDKLFETRKVDDYIIYSEYDGKAVEDAKLFLFYLKEENLHPVSLITYEREPYICKFDGDLRITFDKNLRFLSFVDYHKLFEETKLKPALNNKIIIEIKFNKSFPIWLRDIISYHSLQRRSLSKYTICLDSDKKLNISNIHKKFVISN